MSINGDCPSVLLLRKILIIFLGPVTLLLIFGSLLIIIVWTLCILIVGIIDWLAYLWLNKFWFTKNFDSVLEKIITILWAIWIYRNNVVFKVDKSNPAFILQLTTKIVYETTVYRRCADILTNSRDAGSNSINAGARFNHHNWNPLTTILAEI